MTPFEELVEQSLDRIPERFRRRLHNVAFIVKREPAEEEYDRAGGGRAGSLLGLYEGRPLTGRSVFQPVAMPDRITIFEGPHRRLARNPAHLRSLVADTVLHEVAHYFGMNERQVRGWEMKRERRRGG
ncbi:MAG: metallopeptidase family protein [Bryobacteraceae bacterium]